METINENPDGLHQRYVIRKITGTRKAAGFLRDYRPLEFTTKAVDKDAEYFVMRLDNGGKDPIHIQACRKAVLFYANEIKDHLPDLAKDLIAKYS